MKRSLTIDKLSAQLNSGQLSTSAFVESSVQLISEELDCSRAGLWSYLGCRPNRVLHCIRLYDRVTDTFSRPPDELESHAKEFFAELDRVGHILADDIQTHPATRALYEERWSPFRVKSMMSAAFTLNGSLIGAFTCSQSERPVHWTQEQWIKLTKMGSKATLALARSNGGHLNDELLKLDQT